MIFWLTTLLQIAVCAGQINWNNPMGKLLLARKFDLQPINFINSNTYSVTHPMGKFWVESYQTLAPGVTKITNLKRENAVSLIIDENMGFMVLKDAVNCYATSISQIMEFVQATQNISNQATLKPQTPVRANPWSLQLLRLAKLPTDNLGLFVREECDGFSTFFTQAGTLDMRPANCRPCCGQAPCCQSCLDLLIPGRKCSDFAAARLCVNKIGDRVLF